ncbi:asphd2, partial [Symbiodinium natans]
ELERDLPHDLPLEEALSDALRQSPHWARGRALLAALCEAFVPQNRSCAAYQARIALRLNPKDEVALVVAASIEAKKMPVVFDCNCEDPSLQLVPHSNLGVAPYWYRMPEAAEAAKKTRAALRDRVVALLRRAMDVSFRGEIRAALAAQLGTAPEALELWREAVTQAPESRALLNRAIHHMESLGLAREAKELAAGAVKRGLWSHPDQRPHLFWPALPFNPFPGPELDSRLPRAAAAFAARLEELQTELLRAKIPYTAHSSPCPVGANCTEVLPGLFPRTVRYAGFWETGLIIGRDKPCSAQIPLTCRAIKEILETEGFTVIAATISTVFGPRSSIEPHASAVQGRLRLHCPVALPDGASILEVAGNPQRRHQEGECFWFDESVQHKATYSSVNNLPRTLLMIDIAHPALEDMSGEPTMVTDPFTSRYWHTFFPANPSKPLYASSPLEEEWLQHAQNWTRSPWVFCTKMKAKMLDQWLDGVEASLAKEHPAIFSLFWERSSNTLQWIEPLAGALRHPAAFCESYWRRVPEPLRWKKSFQEHQGDPGHKGGSLDMSLDYLFLSNAAWADKGRRLLFDAGANAFNTSLGWLADAYRKNGIIFDHLWGWEVNPPPTYCVPTEWISRLSFSTEPVVATQGVPNNPVHLMEQLCSPEDFCVFKLDIDEPRIERELVAQILRPGGLAERGVLDEFFWEDHFAFERYGLYGGEGEIQDTYQVLLALRKQGIRAHAWP